MGHNRVAAVDDLRVVAALVEHADVHAENVRNIDCAVHCALVRADNHQVILVRLHIRNVQEAGLDELVGRHEVVKAGERGRILDARVMCVEGDEVLDAHVREFGQHVGAVQRLPLGSSVLTALVEEGHNHIHAVRRRAARRDDAL